jgi:hypothetical protein
MAHPSVYRVDARGCWIWGGAIASNGYGTVQTAEGPKLAHRRAYEKLVGPIPEGTEIDHLCRVRACINPAHLQPVTHQINMQRAAQDRLLPTGFPRFPTREDLEPRRGHNPFANGRYGIGSVAVNDRRQKRRAG